jgi:hypothetical protein
MAPSVPAAVPPVEAARPAAGADLTGVGVGARSVACVVLAVAEVGTRSLSLT